MYLLSEKSFYMKFINQKVFKTLYSVLLSFILISHPYSAKANSNLINPEMKIERKLAYKYCQSIDKNLFEGLDNELILKYQYFFSSISKKSIENVNEFMENFIKEVDSICTNKLKEEEINEFNSYVEEFYFKNNN